MTRDDKEQDNSEDAPEKKPSVLEWSIAILGFLLVAGAVGFMFYRGFTKTSAPPQIHVAKESILPYEDKFLVTFSVKNNGDLTAGAVNIEGELKNGAESVETSDATITYVPSQSERRGGLIFTKNPNDFQLEIRAKGYEQP